MAFFGIGKKKEEKAAEPKVASPREKREAKAPARPASAPQGMKDVLLRPRVTEKAASLTSENVYTFDVRQGATKGEVAKAIQALYKVKPVKVNVVNTPAKRVRMRRKRGFGRVGATRKAYVFLKKGETITVT